jgi:hypothetical protein
MIGDFLSMKLRVKMWRLLSKRRDSESERLDRRGRRNGIHKNRDR